MSDICPDCKDHTEFDDEGYSECCGTKAYDMDPDIDMER